MSSPRRFTITTIVYAACGCTRRLPTAARVARAVADLSEHVGPELQITQAEIARAADTTRETASRMLARLEREGVIEQGRGRIVVRDLPALKSKGGDPAEDRRPFTTSN